MKMVSKRQQFFIVVFLILLVVCVKPLQGDITDSYQFSQIPSQQFTFEPIELIQDPLFAQPKLITYNQLLNISLAIPDNATIHSLVLLNENVTAICANFDESIGETTRAVSIEITPDINPGLYSIYVNTSQGSDLAWNAVRIYSHFPESFNIIHVTDTHIGASAPNWPDPTEPVVDLRYIVARINEINPSLIIFTGDAIEGSINSTENLAQYELFMKTISNLTVPVFLINGNHEMWDSGLEQWETYINPSYQFSLEFGSLSFILTSLYDTTMLPAANVSWLQDEIATANSKGQTTIFAYHTDYGQQFDNMGADIHLAGHEHSSSTETTPDGKLKLITGKAFYTSDVEPAVFRILEFNQQNLENHSLEVIPHPVPTITTPSPPHPTTITIGLPPSSSTLSSSSESSSQQSSSSSSKTQPVQNTSIYFLEVLTVLAMVNIIIYRRIKR